MEQQLHKIRVWRHFPGEKSKIFIYTGTFKQTSPGFIELSTTRDGIFTILEKDFIDAKPATEAV